VDFFCKEGATDGGCVDTTGLRVLVVIETDGDFEEFSNAWAAPVRKSKLTITFKRCIVQLCALKKVWAIKKHYRGR
jgi:hypothetical protein